EATVSDFMRHSQNVTAAERTRTQERLDFRRVTRFHGAGSFIDRHTIRVGMEGEGTLLKGERILIATGSSPMRPPEFPFADHRVHDSDEILQLTVMPKKLAIVGGGVIGSEYAGTFAALGVEVHLIDGRDVLMPFLDEEISLALAEAMAANGVHFHWKERVIACDASQSGDVVLTLSAGAKLPCDGVLVCAGRQSNTGTLNLPAAGISPGKRGLVPVNSRYQSEVPHIY